MIVTTIGFDRQSQYIRLRRYIKIRMRKQNPSQQGVAGAAGANDEEGSMVDVLSSQGITEEGDPPMDQFIKDPVIDLGHNLNFPCSWWVL